MGEHLDSNPTLYVNAGNGWQPMGKIEEMPGFIIEDEEEHIDFFNICDNDFTMTFRMTWWSSVKLRCWMKYEIAKYRIKRLIRKMLNRR